MGRKPAIENIYQCKTLFQYALVSLRDELGVPASQIAETLGLDKVTFNLWLNAKTLPRNEELYLSLVEQFPSLNVARYGQLKSDLEEFKSKPNWPTSGLIGLFKKKGFTYFKSKGQFEKTVNQREKEASEKKVSEFNEFLETARLYSPQGRSLVDMLFQVIPGNKIPEDEDIDYNCIKNKEVFDAVVEREKQKIEALKNLTAILSNKMFVLTHMRTLYLEMTGGESDKELNYENLKYQLILAQEKESENEGD